MFKRVLKYWRNLTHPIIGMVWELHRVTPNRSLDVRYAPYDITPERLESLIVEYMRKGYQFVSIDEIRTRLLTMTKWSQAAKSSKCIAITLDDGYRDNYEVAYPIFQKYNVPFCIYVSTGYIDGVFSPREDHPAMMTKEQLRELADEQLCTLGAHTVSHLNMTKLSIEEQKREIEESFSTIEYITGRKITNIAIPYGAKNQNTIALINNEGIACQVDAWGGPVRMGMSVLSIPRYIVEENKIVK